MQDKYISKNIKSIFPIKNEFFISWHVTGWCNFHCSFCVSARDRTPFTSIAKVNNIAEKLNEFILTNVPEETPVSLRLFGGEPSFYNWTEILNKIKHLNKVSMPTNFSNNLEYYKDLYKYLSNRHITLVLNCAKHDEEKGFDTKIIQLTNWCKENNFREPIVTYVVNNDFDFSQVEALANSGIRRLKLSIERDIYGTNLTLDPEVIDKIAYWNNRYESIATGKTLHIDFESGASEEYTNRMDFTNKMVDGGFDPQGYYCNTGMNNICLWENGDVIYNRCEFMRDKKIGNILTDDIKLLKKPIICNINLNSTSNNKCHLCHNTRISKDINLI